MSIPNQPCVSVTISSGISLPSFLSASPGLTLTFPTGIPAGIIPCCNFKVPAAQLPISLNLPLPAAVTTAVQQALQAALQLLPSIQVPQCNL